MGRSSSSPARAPARRASSSSACAGSWTRGDLLPEQVLVLTYNVKAAKELGERIEAAIGAAAARAAAGHQLPQLLPPGPDRVGRRRRAAQPTRTSSTASARSCSCATSGPTSPLVYHAGGSNPNYWLDQFVGFINRAKDELVTPDDFDAFVDREREAFEARFGSYERRSSALEAQGNLDASSRRPQGLRRPPARGAGRRGGEDVDLDEASRRRPTARPVGRSPGTARRPYRGQFAAEDLPRIDALAEHLRRRRRRARGHAPDRARRSSTAPTRRSSRARGALDFGEQIASSPSSSSRRPNVLRRYQRQYRYILVDEFQDANIAQIELIELLGRTPDRPDNVMVVGDDDQSIYRFRGASFAAFAEFDRRFARPARATTRPAPAPAPPARLRIEENFRSVEHVLTVANRLIERNAAPLRAGQAAAADARPRASRSSSSSRRRRGRGARDRRPHQGLAGWEPSRTAEAPMRPTGRTSPSSTASTGTARRSSPGSATRASRTPSSAGCRCSRRRRSATSSRASARSPTRSRTSRSSG